MAQYRPIYLKIWTDSKIIENFTPEDKLFWLYLLTNERTTQIGVYKFIKKIAGFEIGYSEESINSLIDRFQNSYKMIKYSEKTKEIVVFNWGRYNLKKAGKPILDCIKSEMDKIENKELIKYVLEHGQKEIHFSIIEFLEKQLIDYGVTIRDTTRSTISGQNVDVDVDVYINKDQNQDQKNKDSLKNESTNINKQVLDFFEQIWKMYPNKKGKSRITISNKKELFKVGYYEMKRAIERYMKDSELKINGGFKQCQHGSTFFKKTYIEFLDLNYNEDDYNAQNDTKKIETPSNDYIFDDMKEPINLPGYDSLKKI